MTEHRLKTWPDYWRAVESGEKNFEVRRDDRGFQRGDVLLLEYYDPSAMAPYAYGTKPTLRRRITYVLTGGQFGIEPGYVVLGMASNG